MCMRVKIRAPETENELEKYYELRWRILRRPWGKLRGSEKDGIEEKAIHIIACIDDKVVGVGRVHFNTKKEAQIRYMAVEREYRGKGIGGLILKELEKRARNGGAKQIILNARENVVGFYKKHDYMIVERGHTLFGNIKHWRMQKDFSKCARAR